MRWWGGWAWWGVGVDMAWGWRGNELALWACRRALPCVSRLGRHHNLILIIMNYKFSSSSERLCSSVG